MASVEAKLHALMQEVTRNRESQEKEEQARSRDHDEIIKQGRDLKTVWDKVEDLEKTAVEKQRRGWEIWLAILAAVLALLTSVGSAVIAARSSAATQAIPGGKSP